MTTSLDKLLVNLQSQQGAMVADDMETILLLVEEQEQLLTDVQKAIAVVSSLDGETRDKLAKVRELVETNQLLAQQSLAFSRKMLKALCEDVDYSETGAPRLRPGQALDIRA